MLAELRSIIAKASKLDDEDKIFELTNFDVQEVSNVDAPANEQKYLLIKGALKMSTKKLQEILGDGAGEFISKLEGDADGGNTGDGDADGNGDGDADAPPILKLSETVKNETLQGLGVVIKALINVAKAVDSAEVVAEGGSLPDEIKTIMRSSSQVLGKMLGEAAGDGTGEQGKNADASDGNVAKAKLDSFAQDLDTIGNVIEQLQTALGVSGAGGGDDKGTEGAGDNPELAKALGGITQLLKRQGAAISDLRNRVGLPSALPAEGEQTVTKRAADDFDGWPLDMNENRRRAAR